MSLGLQKDDGVRTVALVRVQNQVPVEVPTKEPVFKKKLVGKITNRIGHVAGTYKI